jgi:hypothetical protein
MGYKHQIPRINVAFEEGHEYHGLKVVLRKLKLGEWLEITGMGDNEEPTVRHVGDQLRRMADKLVSWNLEDEGGRPVPTTLEAVMDQDRELMIAVLNAWLDGLTAVSAPLEASSTGGEPSLVESIPMDTLSASLVS